MKPLRTSVVLLAATAAAVAAMLATSAVDAENERTQNAEAVGLAPSAGASGSGSFQAPVSHDYRAGLFALQAGRLTFGQLWFAASR